MQERKRLEKVEEELSYKIKALLKEEAAKVKEIESLRN